MLGLGLAVLGPAAALAQPLECNHPSGVGCFELTVTGSAGVSAEVSGFANAFGSSADQAWYTQLTEPGGASSVMLIFYGAATPPVDELKVVDYVNTPNPPAGTFVATGSIDPEVIAISGLHSVRGTVVITASSPNWVEGTFSYRAQQATDGHFVTVEGRLKTKSQVG
jgi:hypothetical protein